MGYEITETETLTFPNREGLEVVVKLATTFEEFETIQRIGSDGSGTERDKALAEFAATFIASWNLTAKGEPLPISEFRRLPIDLKADILAAWAKVIRGPSAPLGQGSSNGLDSPTPPTDEPDNP